MDQHSVWIIYHFKQVHYVILQEDNIILRYCFCNCSTMIMVCLLIPMQINSKELSPKLWQICPETPVCVVYHCTLVFNEQSNTN